MVNVLLKPHFYVLHCGKWKDLNYSETLYVEVVLRGSMWFLNKQMCEINRERLVDQPTEYADE